MLRNRLSHTHKVQKKKYKNGSAVYFCTLDQCFFKIEYDMIVGKVVLCNICNEPFAMNESSIKLNKPHCTNCGRTAMKDPETGKKIYVNKAKNKALGAVGASTVSSLKERLSSVISYKPDESDKEGDL